MPYRMAYCVDGERAIAPQEVLKGDAVGAGDGAGIQWVRRVEIRDLIWFVSTPTGQKIGH